jgi:hypothetical protein
MCGPTVPWGTDTPGPGGDAALAFRLGPSPGQDRARGTNIAGGTAIGGMSGA